jgi:RNA-directed DNA polymerase
MDGEAQARAPAVPARATQGAETRDWSRIKGPGWVEASVWTDRMVSALVNGVKGGRWPIAFFADAGLLALHTAWRNARYSR